jgi:hypothetical protein
MAILNTLLGDEAFNGLNDNQLRTLEAKITSALIADPGVHKALESAVDPRKIAEGSG